MAKRKAARKKQPTISQKVSQKVTVIVNQAKRRAGQARKQTIPQQQTIIQMRPVVPSNPMEAYYSQARPQPRSLLEGDAFRLAQIEKSIRELREPFLKQEEQKHLDRIPSIPKLDSDIFEPRIPTKQEPEQVKEREIDLDKIDPDELNRMMEDLNLRPSAPPSRREELSRMTVSQLRVILRDRQVTIGKRNKAEMIDLIIQTD